MLGQPVTIGNVRVAILSPSVVGSDIRVGPEHGGAPAIDLQRIRIVPRIRSLLSRPIVIEEVRLEGLVISILRDRAGQWHIPAAVPAPTADTQSGIVIDRVRLDNSRIRVFDERAEGLREAASLDDVSANAVVEKGGLQLSPLAGRIGTARVNGSARVDPRTARLELTLEQVDDGALDGLLALAGTARPDFLRLSKTASASLSVQIDRTSARLSGRGSVRAPQVVIDPLRVDAFEAPYTLEGSRLTFTPTTFALYGGTHRGTVTLDLAHAPARWSLESRVVDLDLGDFLSALTMREQRIDGTATVNAALNGPVGEPLVRIVNGRAEIDVADGVLSRFPLLAAVNRTLGLAEGDARDTRFDRLSATLSFADGRATTNDLVLQAEEIRVNAAGRIGFDGSLDLTGEAVVSSTRSAAAIRSVHELSGLRNSQGELELPLTIGGTVDDPSFGLDLRRALGKSLRDELQRRIKRFIRREP